MENLNDNILIKNIAKGNKPSINILYQRHKSYWFRICLRYAKSRYEAQDVFQDGVTRIFHELRKFEESKGSFKAWSNRVLIHEVIKSLKRNQWQESFHHIESSDMGMNWNGEIIERITAKELTELIQSLPFGYRTVFNMYEIEGFSHKDIAEMLEISVGTSKSQLSRAKKILQQKIKVLF